jgi:hypothetical protein
MSEPIDSTLSISMAQLDIKINESNRNSKLNPVTVIKTEPVEETGAFGPRAR